MKSERIHQIDALRGFAVLLVLVQHAHSFTSAFLVELGGTRLDDSVLQHIDAVFAPFRMPALLMLSGLFLHHSLRKGLRRYSEGKVRAIVWPLAIWTPITVLATWTAAGMPSFMELATGYRHLWFLVTLTLCYIIGIAATRVPAALITAVILVAALAGQGALGPLHTLAYWSFFFFLGATLSAYADRIRRLGPAFGVPLGLFTLALAALMGAASLGLLPRAAVEWASAVPDNPPSVLTSIPALVFIVWVAPRLPRIHWLEQTGRRSLVYYLSHPITMAAVVWVWLLLGLPWNLTMVWVALAASWAVAWVLARHFDRVRWLFEMPAALMPGARSRRGDGAAHASR